MNHAAQRIGRAVVDVIVFGLGVAVDRGALRPRSWWLKARAGTRIDDIFFYGRALATDTLPEPGGAAGLDSLDHRKRRPAGPSPLAVRSHRLPRLVGNGELAALAGVDSIAGLLLLGPGTTAGRRLTAGWAIAAWAQVALPGLYWQHYYLLPTAGAAIAVAVCFVDALSGAWPTHFGRARRPRSSAGSALALDRPASRRS